jgi:hypothetical protein
MTPQDPTPPIPGSEAVVQWFGGWPTFHDAQIVELRLDAEPVLRLRAFESTDRVDAAGHYELQKECVVSFWFSEGVEFALTSDSGATGIVFDLKFREAAGGLKMEIWSSCGVNGWISAKTWRVELG